MLFLLTKCTSLTACHLMSFWLDFLLYSLPFIKTTPLKIGDLWENKEKRTTSSKAFLLIFFSFSKPLIWIYNRSQLFQLKVSMWTFACLASLLAFANFICPWTIVFSALVKWQSHSMSFINTWQKIIIINVHVLWYPKIPFQCC